MVIGRLPVEALIALLVVVCQSATADEPRAKMKPKKLEPIPEVQDAIRDFLSEGTEEQMRDRFWRLRRMADKETDRVVPQMAYFFMDANRNPPKGDREAWHPVLSLHLPNMLGLQKQEVAHAMAPWTEVEDEEQWKWLAFFLVWNEAINWRMPQPFYEAHVETIKGREKDPPKGLVRYMYMGEPSVALATTMKAFLPSRDRHEQWEPILKGLRVVDTAIWKWKNGLKGEDEIDAAARKQLQAFSTHDYWWVRMHAAAVLRMLPELGDEETIKRLKEDKHELVRETMTKPIPKWEFPPKGK
jgi:hypothetical protein